MRNGMPGMTETTSAAAGGGLDAPAVAVVIPVFKHSVLAAEAICSAIEQVFSLRHVIVVVNDGCPFGETDTHIKAIRAAHPETIHYVVQPNRGLSAARNTGVDYSLATYPTIRAIYFLDADNCLRPRSIESAYALLMQRPEADWVYPNIDMFGLQRNFDYSGPYSLLKHLFYNICEAGSLVHRRVFDAGMRFDESMRHGYEDWEFWLAAAAGGFHGVHHPHFGLLYRNRAESMLSQSKREDDAIRGHVRRKHAELFKPDALQALQDAEAPGHAVICLDTNEVMLGLDGVRPVLPRPAFDCLLWRNIVIPELQHIPPFLLFTTKLAYDELSRAGVMRWVGYDCEIMLDTHAVACLAIERASRSYFSVRPGGETRHCSVLAIKRDVLVEAIMDRESGWIEQLLSSGSNINASVKTLVLPQQAGAAAETAGFGFLYCVMRWRESAFREAARYQWIWRERSVPPTHHLFKEVRWLAGGAVAYPRPREGHRHVGFVLTIGGFGGAERVAFNVAGQFVRAGWTAHLFMLGGDRVELPEEFSDTFATVNFLHEAAFGGLDSRSLYQGTALPTVGQVPGGVSRIEAALGWLDVVINNHCCDLNAAVAGLRRLGVVTATYQHLLDHTPYGRGVGHPIMALAYEHAYDLIICVSRQLRAWLHAAGVPDDKLVVAANAPGYPISSAVRDQIAGRRGQSPGDRLHVLYLGRLDRQKGIGNIAAVITETRRLGLAVDWRVVGSVTIDPSSVPDCVASLLEPPVYQAEELTALFSWADVMVLLSCYEGVPLSILEAQRLGVVVIATDVGAVPEAIRSGVNGFLVRPDRPVDDTVEILRLLIETPGTRAAIALASVTVPDWSDTCTELLQRAERLRAAREREVATQS
jgi:glycosyltransferase involved in cell wall biosynthesis